MSKFLDENGLAKFWENIKNFVQDSTSGNSAQLTNVPVGGIIWWSGAADTIPEGWHICDGTEGTVDLRDKFILAAGNTHPVGNTGGQETVLLEKGHLPKHSHNIRYYSSSATTKPSQAAVLGTSDSPIKINTGVKTYNTIGATEEIGNDVPHPNMPPYYALYAIQKIAASPTDYATIKDVEEMTGAVYSTEERKIGTWIDGKPLYQRTVTVPGLTALNEDTIIYSLPSTELVVSFDAYVVWDSYSIYNIMPVPISDGSSFYNIYQMKNPNAFRASTNSSGYLNKSIRIIMSYTKTTD